MNIASPHTILAVKRGSSGLCKAEPSTRSWKGIPALPKPIGLAGDEDPPYTHLTSLQLPLPCHWRPLHPLFFPIQEWSWRTMEREESQEYLGEGRSNSHFQIELVRHLYVCTVSRKPLKTSRCLLLVFDSLHGKDQCDSEWLNSLVGKDLLEVIWPKPPTHNMASFGLRSSCSVSCFTWALNTAKQGDFTASPGTPASIQPSSWWKLLSGSPVKISLAAAYCPPVGPRPCPALTCPHPQGGVRSPGLGLPSVPPSCPSPG